MQDSKNGLVNTDINKIKGEKSPFFLSLKISKLINVNIFDILNNDKLMDDKLSLEWLWGVLGVAGGFVVRLIFDKKKVHAENRQEEAKAKDAEIEADSKAVEMYERFASQTIDRMEKLQASHDVLHQEFQKIRSENSDLKFDNQQLKRENGILRKENEELKTNISSIKRELNEVKKQMGV